MNIIILYIVNRSKNFKAKKNDKVLIIAIFALISSIFSGICFAIFIWLYKVSKIYDCRIPAIVFGVILGISILTLIIFAILQKLNCSNNKN